MKNTFRPAKLLTASEMSAKLAAGQADRARRAALRVQIAAEMGNSLATYSPAVISEANRRMNASAS